LKGARYREKGEWKKRRREEEKRRMGEGVNGTRYSLPNRRMRVGETGTKESNCPDNSYYGSTTTNPRINELEKVFNWKSAMAKFNGSRSLIGLILMGM
jgi:hypothetical protein